ncbi:fatty acid desaturase [Yoonia sp. BS5-3]|uniref:Fatty acid desaturase n=1 Tax=Yoonia phaeophyticola TaxID=3137369 RepID=A0ABZ2V9J1_9RHOB
MDQKKITPRAIVEWPTFILITTCYGLWGAAMWWLPTTLAIPCLGVLIAFHASLQHEAIHGHPFRWQGLNDALVAAPLALFIPYLRFKATHLAHHSDIRLTDPFDDPESNFLDPAEWQGLPRALRKILLFNNTLLGRLVLGPVIGVIGFMRMEWQQRTPTIARGWLWHIPGVLAVLFVIQAASFPMWAYLIAVYLGLALLKLRTFLEHQAHQCAGGRSVIIEDRGFFAFLFLNNNLHVVHHMHPKVPWYALPDLYLARKDYYQRRNGGYLYRSYGAIMRQYFWKAKDPVAHPLWRR